MVSVIKLYNRLIITRQTAFNKHVLKDYLVTAASVGTQIKWEQKSLFNRHLKTTESLPDTAQRMKKMKEN